MKVTVQRGQKVDEFELDNGASVADLKAAYAKKYKSMYTTRQRLSVERANKKDVLRDEQFLAQLELKQDERIVCKDLGPQVDYRKVFVVEYAGPMLFHLIVYFGYEYYYGVKLDSIKQQLLIMFVAHFMKREFESVFVHRFSHATMPIMNLFKNSAHYWILGGLFTAIELYRPSHVTMQNELYINLLTGVWFFAQVSNLTTHIILRGLRKPGSKERTIPYGYGFNLVSCPNYTFEILGWIAFAIISQSYVAALFAVVGGVQMALWAIKKHKAYRKDFKDYPRNRKILIPFIW